MAPNGQIGLGACKMPLIICSLDQHFFRLSGGVAQRTLGVATKLWSFIVILEAERLLPVAIISGSKGG